MSNLYSDGQGGFLYFDKCKDDENFIDLKIEEEQEDNSYISVNISLYKDDIKDFAKELGTLAEGEIHNKTKVSEYIVTVSYFPIVVGKNEIFKISTELTKEEIYHKILKEKELENEFYEVDVLVETIEEYLKDIPTIEL